MRQGRQQLAEELQQRRISAKEITLAQLLLEEMFFRLKKGMGAGADFSVSISLRRMWGDTELRLLAKGEEYNPIPAVTEASADETEEDAYQLAILKANRQKMNYVRKNALHMMMAPVTFFAIIAGITNISDAALIGKLGGRMVVVSLFMQVIVKAIPLMVFLSMASLLASTGLESLVTFSGLFGGLVIG